MNTHLARRARLIAAIVLPIFAAVALAVVLDGSGSGGNTAARPDLYSPGEASRMDVERYWQTRLTYPTGRFNQGWMRDAAEQAKRIRAAIPKGTYRPWRAGKVGSNGTLSRNQSIKALSAARPLGPDRKSVV
jgi:hypothetical protein